MEIRHWKAEGESKKKQKEKNEAGMVVQIPNWSIFKRKTKRKEKTKQNKTEAGVSRGGRHHSNVTDSVTIYKATLNFELLI